MANALHSARSAFLTAMIAYALLGASCTTRLERRLVTADELATLDGEAAFLKAHLRSGNLVVFDSWRQENDGHNVAGSGTLFGINRQEIRSGYLNVHVDSVAIFETNTTKVSGVTAALAVLTGVSAGLTIMCLTNTKACFGSCPTFYVDSGGGPRLMAEGFSSSIAPSLEATDIDHLYRASTPGPVLTIEMRNEALETHVVRSADLLVARRPADGRVVRGKNDVLVNVQHLMPPRGCRGLNGVCVEVLQAFDDLEYFSQTDSSDLGVTEEVELTFDTRGSRDGPPGLVIAARQSLVSTFLLYQALAYMGGDVSEWFARIERGELRGRSPGSSLGGIEVAVQTAEGSWMDVDVVMEHGPLASDVRLVELPEEFRETGKVKLRMSRGSWRIDYAALGDVVGAADHVRVRPFEVSSRGRQAEDALRLLLSPGESLVTMPGDAYEIAYRIPPREGPVDVFLESRGYYLEWIRREWMAEENPGRLVDWMMNPAQMLKALAPSFKEIESDVERAFWNSQYVERN